jgi:hypothetical protein
MLLPVPGCLGSYGLSFVISGRGIDTAFASAALTIAADFSSAYTHRQQIKEKNGTGRLLKPANKPNGNLCLLLDVALPPLRLVPWLPLPHHQLLPD